jgi:hypothetical protein
VICTQASSNFLFVDYFCRLKRKIYNFHFFVVPFKCFWDIYYLPATTVFLHLQFFLHMTPLGNMDSGFIVQKFTNVYPQIIVLILKYFKSSYYILVNITATLTPNTSSSTILELFKNSKWQFKSSFQNYVTSVTHKSICIVILLRLKLTECW